MRYRKVLLAIGILLLVSVFVAARPRQEGTPPWAGRGQPSSRTPQARTPGAQPMTTADIKKIFPYLSGGTQEVLAAKLGITSLMGKKIDISRKSGLDNLVGAEANTNENEPSIAVNPANPSIVVAFHHFYPTLDECVAKVSYDGGNTFNAQNVVALPLQAAGNTCSDPIVRFSPDGSTVYYVYMDIDATGNYADIVMVRGDGYDPLTLIDATPIVVLDDFGTDFLDKPWMDVAYYDDSGASDPVVYVTATLFTGADCGIVFNVSMDYGATWMYGATGIDLDYSPNCDRVLQGSRPIGNPAPGWVTACWFDSGLDGWQNGYFDINCWSNDNWGDVGTGTNYYFTAATKKYEPPYYLGPNSNYHRWWGIAFPALAVDNTGLLYVAFGADPTKNANDAESGDIFLARGWPDGFGWRTMVIADGSPVKRAQGWATVAAQCDYQTNKCFAYVAFADHKKGPNGANELYRVVYRKIVRPFNPLRVGRMRKMRIKQISDRFSFSDYSFIGDYFDSALTARRYMVIWTDRADATGVMDFDDDVLMDVLLP